MAENASTCISGLRPPRPLEISNSMATVWKTWRQRFEWYSTAIGLKDKPAEIQAATLMTTIGDDAATIYNSFGLTEAESKNITIILQRFEKYFIPKVNLAFERYKFNSMTQKPGETFDEFLTDARIQCMKCEYQLLQDELLRDRLIMGVNNDKVREQLLSDPDITLAKVIDICKANEQAVRQLGVMGRENALIEAVREYGKPVKTVDKRSELATCGKCGYKHKWGRCPAFGKTCAKCGGIGHFAKTCKNRERTKSGQRKANEIDEVVGDDSSMVEELYITEIMLNEVATDKEDCWYTMADVEKMKVNLKLDTGAECNVLPLRIAQEIKKPIKTSKTKRIISYTKDTVNVVGEVEADCVIENKKCNLTFLVIGGGVSPILGKSACVELGLVRRVYEAEVNKKIFEGLGCLKNYEYDIDLKPNPTFSIRAPRRIPYALRDSVKMELDKMESMGVIEHINEPTPCVSQLVVVQQKNKLRLCMDPVELNKNILRRHHPLRTLEEIAARLKGAKYFTLLDCSKGFWQIKVSMRTSKYLAFATHWGRYCFKRLPFGIASAPEVFQEAMGTLLKDIPNVECSMDDILIYNETKEGLEKVTKVVLKTLSDVGLTLNKSKCVFAKESLKFLGHVVSKEGLQRDPEKLDTIEKLKRPTNKEELRRWLGVATYMSRFIPHYSRKIEPLRELLKTQVQWVWGEDQENALEEVKRALKQSTVLAFFDVNAPVKLSVDASSKSLGAVLLQEDRPIAFASAALTKSQQNYPQIAKEALAVRFGCDKFHAYLYGKQVTIETDHKPLETLAKKPLSSAPPRLQRILFDLQQYSPSIVYKKGSELLLADALSRDVNNTLTYEDLSLTAMSVCQILPVSDTKYKALQIATAADGTLGRVMWFCRNGWPATGGSLVDELRRYWVIKDELSVNDGIVFKGEKIIIPLTMRSDLVQQVHRGHLGIQSCLRRARDLLYWPGMSNDITRMVQRCAVCQSTQRAPAKEPLLLKEVPEYPGQVIATDIMYYGQDYLVIMDSYSGFLDVRKLNRSSSSEVIDHLKYWFSSYGISEVLETDNGPQFSSREFRKFTKEWNIQHRRSSPRYPQSNGLAERAVQIAKNILRKCDKDGSDFQLGLLAYRNTPRGSTLASPAQRFFSRRTRTTLPCSADSLRPKVETGVTSQLELARLRQKRYADRGSTSAPTMQTGDNVRFRVGHRHWIPGKLLSASGEPRSWNIATASGILRRNQNVIRPTAATDWRDVSVSNHTSVSGTNEEPNQPVTSAVTPPQTVPNEATPCSPLVAPLASRQPSERQCYQYVEVPSSLSGTVTRSGRIVKPRTVLQL